MTRTSSAGGLNQASSLSSAPACSSQKGMSMSAVQRRGGGEVLAGLLALVRAPVEFGEAEVAVGDERAHAALLGES